MVDTPREIDLNKLSKIGYYMNDLLYTSDLADLLNEHTEESINKFLQQYEERIPTINVSMAIIRGLCFLVARKDIQKEEEMGKFYGVDYWLSELAQRTYFNLSILATQKLEIALENAYNSPCYKIMKDRAENNLGDSNGYKEVILNLEKEFQKYCLSSPR